MKMLITTLVVNNRIALVTKVPRGKIGKKIKLVNTVSTLAKEALERGGGCACLATHDNGCCHYGILDLREMDQKTFNYYSKEGGLLENKFCVACELHTKDMCIDKGTKSYLQYCKMGLKSIKYCMYENEDEKAYFDNHDCKMILCIACWNERVISHEQDIKDKMGITSKRSSARKKI